jgi:hypothetical protein
MSEVTFVKYVPKGKTAPTTVLEALIAARDLLVDEHRWTKAEWFCNQDPHLNPNDPFCNSWRVCAQGAINTVTIGMASADQMYELADANKASGCWLSTPDQREASPWVMVSDEYELTHYHLAPEEDVQLYRATSDALLFALNSGVSYDEDAEEYDGAYWDSIPEFNDTDETTRDDVMAAFDKAIALQEATVNA